MEEQLGLNSVANVSYVSNIHKPAISLRTRELIDLRSPASPKGWSYTARLHVGGVTLARCRLAASAGTALGTVQTALAVLLNKPVAKEWGMSESDEFRYGILRPGCVDIYPAGQSVWQRWSTEAEYFIIALDPSFVASSWQQAFTEGVSVELQAGIGLDDPVIGGFAELLQRTLADSGSARRCYVENLATALAIHLARCHGVVSRRAVRTAGKLSSFQLRRVIAYIDGHLTRHLTLVELAAVVNVSASHFAHGFKQSLGISPRRYVLERRIEEVKKLLAHSPLSLAEMAAAVGFSSQGHMTTVFRRFVGITPKVFRDSL